MVQNPRELSKHRSKPKSSLGNDDVEKLLDSESVAEFVGHCGARSSVRCRKVGDRGKMSKRGGSKKGGRESARERRWSRETRRRRDREQERTHRDVIQPIKVRKSLSIVLVLNELLRSSMEESDVSVNQTTRSARFSRTRALEERQLRTDRLEVLSTEPIETHEPSQLYTCKERKRTRSKERRKNENVPLHSTRESTSTLHGLLDAEVQS